jgi:hypothetical protein
MVQNEMMKSSLFAANRGSVLLVEDLRHGHLRSTRASMGVLVNARSTPHISFPRVPSSKPASVKENALLGRRFASTCNPEIHPPERVSKADACEQAGEGSVGASSADDDHDVSWLLLPFWGLYPKTKATLRLGNYSSTSLGHKGP